MLFLSSHLEQSKKSTEYDATQFNVAYSEEEMLRTYEQSKYIDCRVSIYRSPYVKYDHQADSKAFLICKWCFWCASNLSTKKMITQCPMCDNKALLNSIPISDKEVYEIDSSQRSRIRMEPAEFCANATT
jgi:hypothetical protein